MMEMHFSLIWPNHICHRRVRSSLDKDTETTVEHVTVEPYRIYRLPCLRPFITTRAPLDTFKTPPLVEYLHPLDLRVPKEIRLRVMSWMWQTLVKVLKIASWVLIFTLPIPSYIALGIVAYKDNTRIKRIVCWQISPYKDTYDVKPASKIHSVKFLFSKAIASNTSPSDSDSIKSATVVFWGCLFFSSLSFIFFNL